MEVFRYDRLYVLAQRKGRLGGWARWMWHIRMRRMAWVWWRQRTDAATTVLTMRSFLKRTTIVDWTWVSAVAHWLEETIGKGTNRWTFVRIRRLVDLVGDDRIDQRGCRQRRIRATARATCGYHLGRVMHKRWSLHRVVTAVGCWPKS